MPYAVLAATLTALSALPRVAFLHGYVQPKLEYDLFSSASLDTLMTSASGAAVGGALTAIVLVGAISAAAEQLTMNWARPPRTALEELNAIADALETDQLYVRKLEERYEAMDPQRESPAVIKVAKQQADKALANAEAFERVADAWLTEFHGLSSEEVEIDDQGRSDVGKPAVGASFLSGAAAAASYAATGGSLEAPLLLHGLSALVDSFAPTPNDLLKPKSATFDVDGAKN